VLERRMNVIVKGVEEIDSEWKAEGYMKKAYDMEQVALIAHAKAPEYTWNDNKEAIQHCVRLGKDPTHSKRPLKVVFTFGMVYSGLTRTYNKIPFTEILAGRT
jgi:hypothetical protein